LAALIGISRNRDGTGFASAVDTQLAG
jgi:hypothetical protein